VIAQLDLQARHILCFDDFLFATHSLQHLGNGISEEWVVIGNNKFRHYFYASAGISF